MIQRIQSLYLIIAGVFVSVLFFVPVAVLSGKEGNLYLVYLSGVVSEGTSNRATIAESWPLLIYASVVLIFLVSIIFLFRNRMLQIRLSYVALVNLLVLAALIFFYVWKSQNSLGGIYSMKIYFSFTFVSAVFVYLAIRGIAKDDKLVKSIDRIR